ncbi:Os02g0666000 [Oryza sativa Japonica Group]|uniref:Os02g0666000 protein n=3 Tax=Oryza TaxID=4527 RepID=Q0DYV3_ORYSJ|nr:hypothetical protein EE612_012886 [Oryza sativa]BAD27774.1 unknown protein [Oryza sativa Japonica Group]BAD28397.1 unknown protein [Oryza sativa Japonica Group]BAF09585.1 Os02g0666000 [Oryza sativa Japonica Group]BAS80185.1 Os02g0666000 [Oryza sativa Japonica Group]|eukprot:NP_001047671.1 Os02g0666000 [Oryza sativa Japonica Group]
MFVYCYACMHASGEGDVAEPGREAREVGLGGDGPSEREEVVLDLGPELVVPAAEEGEQGCAVVGEEPAMQLRRQQPAGSPPAACVHACPPALRLLSA